MQRNPQIPTLRWYRVVGLCLLSGLVSCGGGGGGGNTLGGTINAASFTVPAGQTRVVTRDLVVTTTGDIEVDGVLQVSPGVNVALNAGGNFTLHGQIVAAPGKAPARAGRQDSTTPTYWATSGQNVNIKPDPALAPTAIAPASGVGVYISVNKAPGTITISGDITTANGEDAADSTSKAGEDAGSINIGNQYVFTPPNTFTKTGILPDSVTISSKLIAGAGGHGSNDLRVNAMADPMVLSGGQGGGGGFVTIYFNKSFVGTGATLQAGTGGRGGDCGDRTNPAKVRAADGVANGAAGHSLTASTGSGGQGGGVTVNQVGADGTTTDVTPTSAVGGTGGAPGGLYAAAGNGGPGGKGGNITATFGTQGNNWTHAPAGATPGPATGDIRNSGNGGNAPSADYNGGDGGYIDITWLGQILRVKAPISNIAITASGNGGKGFDCTSSSEPKGTNGGSAGTVPTLAAHVALRVLGAPYTRVTSFNGGNGGKGTPAGSGGAGGLDDANKVIGSDGNKGDPGCQPGNISIPTGQVENVVYIQSADTIAASVPSTSTIVFIDASSFAITGSMSPFTSGGATPKEWGLTVLGPGLWTSGSGWQFITEFDATTHNTIKHINVGSNPLDLSSSAATNMLYLVANGGAALDIIDPNGNTPTAVTLPATGLQSVRYDPVTNRIFVDSGPANTLYMVDPNSPNSVLGSVATGASPMGIDVDTMTGHVFVTNSGDNTLTVTDGTGTKLATVGVGKQPRAVVADAASQRAFVSNFGDGTVSILDTSTNTVSSTMPAGAGPGHMAYDPKNYVLFVADNDGTVDVVPVGPGKAARRAALSARGSR